MCQVSLTNLSIKFEKFSKNIKFYSKHFGTKCMPHSFQNPTVLALARRKKLRRAGLFAQACLPMVQASLILLT